MSGNITAVAHDPVQSLLAVATNSKEIHIYGQQQVEVVFTLSVSSDVEYLKFVKSVYLVGVDHKGNIMVFSLLQKKLLYSVLAPGKPTAIESDPSLDWLLLGMPNGNVLVFDIDRGIMTNQFGIENLQRQILPKARLSSVVSIQWNPRDIGTLLIAYTHCAAVYSLATGEIKASFHYEVPANAPGGDGVSRPVVRHPIITKAIYHPNSLNIITVHEDGSLVFWDALTGRLILARTLHDVDVNLPSDSKSGSSGVPEIISEVWWITSENPDDTELLISSDHGCVLTRLKFGVAPKYSITSYEKMNQYYAHPKAQGVIPLENSAPVKKIIPLASTSPFFNGADNPSHILLVLNSGEVEILDYPSYTTANKSSFFPQSLTWIRPKTTVTKTFSVPKKQWLGIISRSARKENILKGGLAARKPLRSNEISYALVTGHSNGFVRLWDASHGELDDSSVIDLDVADSLGAAHDIPIEAVSFAGENAELAVALQNGDVALFKFGVNPRFDPRKIESLRSLKGGVSKSGKALVDLQDRVPNVKEGFLPVCGIFSAHKRGKTTAINNSNVGFVAIAYENGDLVIVDRRGPAIIFDENVIGSSTNGKSSHLTSLEFSIMSYGDDSYSSILLFGGSNKGELYTYKVLPEASGRFTGQLIDVIEANDYGINNIIPFKVELGTPCVATLESFNKLADGVLIQGSVLTSSSKDVRIITPGKHKLSHKIFNQEILASGLSIIKVSNPIKPYGSVIPTLLSNNTVKILSNPELKEISSLSLPFKINSQWGPFSTVLPSGDIVIRLDESEAEVISITGSGKQLHQLQTDRIFNDKVRIPYRPTIGTAQWIKGTTLITYHDLDLLIGGEKRPESKNAQESAIASGNVTLVEPGSSSPAAKDEFAYDKPVRKRTQGGYDPSRYIMHSFQNGIESIEESFNDYANTASQNMNESIGNVKQDLVSSVVKSKFGL